MAKILNDLKFKKKDKKKGLYAKSKTSSLKSSKNYKKDYRGQGR